MGRLRTGDMVSDFVSVVDFSCAVKHSLGGGDIPAGTRAAVEAVRTDPSAPSLATVAAGCVNCPANVRRMPFGCVAPPTTFPAAAEKWLLDRLQPPTSVGGAAFLQTVAMEKLTGEPTRALRSAGAFESPVGLSIPLPTNPFDRAEATADELLHWAAVGRLAPWQCLSFLMWMAAVKIDGELPQSFDDARTLTRLTPSERAKRAKITLGPGGDPTIEPARDLLKVVFVAWARNVDVVVVS